MYNVVLNMKLILNIGMALKTFISADKSSFSQVVKVYKDNKKKWFTLNHTHLQAGMLIKDLAFISQAKFIITLAANLNTMISIFKVKTEKLITYIDINE